MYASLPVEHICLNPEAKQMEAASAIWFVLLLYLIAVRSIYLMSQKIVHFSLPAVKSKKSCTAYSKQTTIYYIHLSTRLIS